MRLRCPLEPRARIAVAARLTTIPTSATISTGTPSTCSGRHEPSQRVDHDHHRQDQQRHAVGLGGEDLGAAQPVGHRSAGGPRGQPRRDQRHPERRGVGEHVRRVGEQGQRRGQHAGGDLGQHEDDDQRQRRLQRAALGLARGAVVVVIVGVVVRHGRPAAASSPTGRGACAPPARSCPPCASAPWTTGPVGAPVNASSRRAGSRIQSPRSSSSSSCPGPQPAWPTNARPRRTLIDGSSCAAVGQHADVVEGDQRGLGGLVELGQHDQRRGLDGAADVQRVVEVEELLELGHGLADGRLRRPVEHQAERAVVGVLHDQDDRAPEVGVQQSRARYQQLTSCRVHAI